MTKEIDKKQKVEPETTGETMIYEELMHALADQIIDKKPRKPKKPHAPACVAATPEGVKSAKK